MSTAAIASLFSKFLMSGKQMKLFSKGMESAKVFADKAKDLIGLSESTNKLMGAFDVLKIPLKLITADMIGPVMESNIKLMQEMITSTKDPSFQLVLKILNKMLTNFIDATAWLVRYNNESTSAFKLLIKFVSLISDLNTVTSNVNLVLPNMITELARLLRLAGMPTYDVEYDVPSGFSGTLAPTPVWNPPPTTYGDGDVR